MTTLQQLIRFFWGTIAHPRTTFDALTTVRSMRWALAVAILPVFQVWGNVALHTVFGFDWLGTRLILADPTFIAGFGHWRVDRAAFILVFVVLMPLLALWGLLLTTGTALLVSKLWRGQGTFEQLITPLAFATVVPAVTLGATSEGLFSVPMNLISGHPYWWTAAMYGDSDLLVRVHWGAGRAAGARCAGCSLEGDNSTVALKCFPNDSPMRGALARINPLLREIYSL